jgi:hypothetical protein
MVIAHITIEIIAYYIRCPIGVERGGVMLSQHGVTEAARNCKQAAASILELLKSQCQGFILPPAEVRNLLGLSHDDRKWHLHESIGQLKKELARRFVAMEVNPVQGITVQLYRVPLQSYVLCSPRSLRQ